MEKKRVHLEEIRESEGKEYIIRDADRITVGRFTIIEKNEAQKSVLLRLRFYSATEKGLLKEALRVLVRGFLREGAFFKINIIVTDEISTTPFTELGFTLEGILVNNSYSHAEITNEYLFGTDNTRFDQFREFKLLALEGERTTLKLASPEDAEAFAQYYTWNREYLRRFEPLRDKEFFTVEGQRKALEESYRNYLNGLAINFGIYSGTTLIGKAQLSNLVYGGFRSANLGYSLHRDYEGKGLMQDALKAVLAYAGEELRLHRIEASTLLENTRSQNTLKKLGFKLVGLNEKYLYINGQWQDHYTYSLILE